MVILIVSAHLHPYTQHSELSLTYSNNNTVNLKFGKSKINVLYNQVSTYALLILTGQYGIHLLTRIAGQAYELNTYRVA